MLGYRNCINDVKLCIMKECKNEMGNFVASFDIIPDTVCAFTGLKDSNGREIYEGDIVVTQECCSNILTNKGKKERLVGVVEYTNDGCFSDDNCDARWKINTSNDKNSSEYTNCKFSSFYDCSVVGNIYDKEKGDCYA